MKNQPMRQRPRGSHGDSYRSSYRGTIAIISLVGALALAIAATPLL